MDGLLGSEFALVLRDSLNSTPRRHVRTSASAAGPSPQKKPRAADFGIRCDMQLEPRLQFAPFPTSPTSPLPSPSIVESPASVSAPPAKTRPLPSPGRLGILDKDLPVSLEGHAIAKEKRTSVDSKRPSARRVRSPPPSPSPRHASSMCTRPLDVLAAVSLEQQVEPELRLLTRGKTFPSYSRKGKDASAFPTSPVNSEGVSPLFSDEKKVKLKTGKGKQSSTGRIFSCTQCSSTFSQQFNLNKHIRAVHERRRPFQCDVCHARFQQKSHRTMHHLAVHEKLRQFSCDQCNASFSWRGVLKKHRKSIHGLDS